MKIMKSAESVKSVKIALLESEAGNVYVAPAVY